MGEVLFCSLFCLYFLLLPFLLASLSLFHVTSFLQISRDPVNLFMCKNDTSKKWIGSSVCELMGFSVGSPGGHLDFSWEDHTYHYLQVFSLGLKLCFFRDISTSLLPEKKRHTHGCYKPVQCSRAVSKKVFPLGVWLGKRCPSGHKPPMGSWPNWQKASFVSFSRARLEEQSEG